MKRDTFTLQLLPEELIIDNFAGGGGTSTGLEAAFGRPVDLAINHDPQAVAMHRANHPHSRHLCESVWEVDPRSVLGPVGLVWLSPDCKHFSKAKGGQPVEKRIRGLAWVALRWAAVKRPRVIMLENVEEFVTWGPLVEGPDGKMRPCPVRKGREFGAFTNALRRQGYAVDWRELRACDYGAPTIRKRFFLIARRDGLPIRWPEPTHGALGTAEVLAGRRKPWRTAAECIDWRLPCPSIFERARPLADATLRRIAKGVMRYVVDAAEPFIVPITHTGSDRVHRIGEPLRTITTANRGELALVTAFLAKHYGDRGQRPGSELAEPMATITACDHHSLVASHLVKLRGTNVGGPCDAPLPTITAGGWHHAEVRAFLVKYYGSDQDPRLTEPLHTVTTKDRFGLVTVAGEDYAIADIGMRMLAPRELFRAQGFPENYVIEHGIDDAGDRIALSKSAQVRMCGNSVCPPVARALVEANFEHEPAWRVLA